MKKKIKVVIKPHSIIDVITNSSTEIFCAINSKDHFEDIKLFLENILNKEVEIYKEYEENKYIVFSIEYGENENIKNDFIKLLKRVLEENFGKDNFEIRTDVGY